MRGHVYELLYYEVSNMRVKIFELSDNVVVFKNIG